MIRDKGWRYDRMAALQQLEAGMDRAFYAARIHAEEHGASEIVEKTVITTSNGEKRERTERHSLLEILDEIRKMDKHLSDGGAGWHEAETDAKAAPPWLIARVLQTLPASAMTHCPVKPDSTETSEVDSKDSRDQ